MMEFIRAIPLELITWLEYIVVGGLALAAVYAAWLRWKNRGTDFGGDDWLDTETYEARRQREAEAKAAAAQAAVVESTAAEPEPATAEPGDGR